MASGTEFREGFGSGVAAGSGVDELNSSHFRSSTELRGARVIGRIRQEDQNGERFESLPKDKRRADLKSGEREEIIVNGEICVIEGTLVYKLGKNRT